MGFLAIFNSQFLPLSSSPVPPSGAVWVADSAAAAVGCFGCLYRLAKFIMLVFVLVPNQTEYPTRKKT